MNEWLLSHQGSPPWLLATFLLENLTVRHLRSSFPPHVNMIQFIRHHQLNILHTYKVGSRAVKSMYSQDSSVGKESACNAGDLSSILRLGRCPGEGIGYPLQYSWASLVAQLVKNLPAMWETWVWSLGLGDPLENGKSTHSSILAWRIPWTVQSTGSQRVRHDWATSIFLFTRTLTVIRKQFECLNQTTQNIFL